MEIKDLTNLISKLNDRNLQRQRESGFTLYAIIGAFIFIIYSIFDIVFEISKNIKIYEHSFILATFIIDSLCIILFCIIYIASFPKEQSIRRLFPNILSANNFTINLSFLIASIFFAYVNFQSIIYLNVINASFNHIGFWIMGIYLCTNIWYFTILPLFSFIKNYKKKIRYPNVRIIRKKIYIVNAIILMLILGFSIYFLLNEIFNINFQLSLSEKILSLKLGFYVFSFSISIIYFANYYNHRNKYDWLEQLEIDIYLEDLVYSEIIEKFENEYVGYNTIKWIRKRKEYFIDKDILYMKELKKYEMEYSDIKEVENISINMDKIQILRKLSDNVYNVFDNYNKTTQEVLLQINKLSDNIFPNEKEGKEIDLLIENITDNYEIFKNYYFSLYRDIMKYVGDLFDCSSKNNRS